MESRYNKVNKVEIFEERELVHPKIPVEHKCPADNKQIFCKVIKARQGNRYLLQCQYGILHGLSHTKKMDRTVPHQFPPYKKDSHRQVTFWRAAHLQSPAEFMQVRYGCKGNWATVETTVGTKLTCRLGRVLGSPSTAGIVQHAPNSLSLGTAPNSPWLSGVSSASFLV